MEDNSEPGRLNGQWSEQPGFVTVNGGGSMSRVDSATLTVVILMTARGFSSLTPQPIAFRLSRE